MKIAWYWRASVDIVALYAFLNYFALFPTMFWRHNKMEAIRWTQRRRQYAGNPYFSAPAQWQNDYDKEYRVTNQL